MPRLNLLTIKASHDEARLLFVASRVEVVKSVSDLNGSLKSLERMIIKSLQTDCG